MTVQRRIQNPFQTNKMECTQLTTYQSSKQLAT